MSVLSAPYFHDEAEAFAYLESVIWPEGPTCPHCGAVDRISSVKPNKEKRVRMGLKKCGHCKGQFTVKVGTVFEHGRMPLNLMLQAVYLMTSSKKGISAHQLHRTLGITYKSAWFLAHRIREAMRSGDLAPFDAGGGFVEVDETYIGRIKGTEKKQDYQHKMKVLSLLDHTTGHTRMMHVDKVTVASVTPILKANIAAEAHLPTDDAGYYRLMHLHFAGHATTPRTKGVYQHCGEQHLHRYLAEFELRYNNRMANGVNDAERQTVALEGIVGKRLTYQWAWHGEANSGLDLRRIKTHLWVNPARPEAQASTLGRPLFQGPFSFLGAGRQTRHAQKPLSLQTT